MKDLTRQSKRLLTRLIAKIHDHNSTFSIANDKWLMEEMLLITTASLRDIYQEGMRYQRILDLKKNKN